jgi:hypothetical protein
MLEILEALTPSEFFLWAWLCRAPDLVVSFRSSSCRFYTPQHLKRIIKSLESKRFLVILSSPRKQYRELVLSLSPSKRLNISVQASEPQCLPAAAQNPLPLLYKPPGHELVGKMRFH